MPPLPLPFLFPLSVFLLLLLYTASAAGGCAKTTALAGLEADLTMVQHQVRGVFRILDGCSFSVRSFDMLAGSPDVRWWGASSADFEGLIAGFPISDLPLDRTYRNESFSVRLPDDASWDRIAVIAVWDGATASNFGHVVLRNAGSDGIDPPLSPSSDLPVAPSPAPNSSTELRRASRIRHQPTMFDNCLSLSARYRLRWTLYPESSTIHIGLEAAVGSEYYMAFGWAASGSESPMLNADVVVAGFTEKGVPFADDYFITQLSECLVGEDGKAEGVCPDTVYEGLNSAGVNNTKLLYGYRKDGISFVRYERPLVSVDEKYDVPVNMTDSMTVIWALGLIRPPDLRRPYYLPQNHGGPPQTTYGYFSFSVSQQVNDCLGPLDAEEKEDQALIIADGKMPLVVSSGPATHYPNPPNPSKVLYIDRKEAPLLRVERGVPVTFSIQTGHGEALYITSDPIGGNATSQNRSEIIYAGGPHFEGVPSSPVELLWLPDRNTPDLVFYQSLSVQKMGWKIQVVDGGLSDMYNNSVLLDDQQVAFFWTLSDGSISIAARGQKKSGYLAVGFGSGMVNSYVYVGWMDNEGKCHVNTYWINGKNAMNIHQTSEDLTYARCRSENGIITFEFTRPLKPSCRGKKECNNIVDPTSPLKVIWAMGTQWSKDNLRESNMHSLTSSRPVRVLLLRGSAEAEQDLRPVLAVHGFMMFLAWGILLPSGILAARYLKHVKGDGWYRLHVYLQYSGIAIMLLGVLFAAAELRGFHIASAHVKFGVTAIILACAQPVNAYVRPKQPAEGEVACSNRIIWEYFHVISGRCGILVGIAALFSGMNNLGNRYDAESVDGLAWALILWVLTSSLLILYLEYATVRRRRILLNSLRGNWVSGNSEEDDSINLLGQDTEDVPDCHSSRAMELQLETLSRRID